MRIVPETKKDKSSELENKISQHSQRIEIVLGLRADLNNAVLAAAQLLNELLQSLVVLLCLLLVFDVLRAGDAVQNIFDQSVHEPGAQINGLQAVVMLASLAPDLTLQNFEIFAASVQGFDAVLANLDMLFHVVPKRPEQHNFSTRRILIQSGELGLIQFHMQGKIGR